MRARLVFLLGLAGVVFAAACEAESYVFTARRYDATQSCLDPYSTIDLIEGSGAGNACGPTCFRYNKDVYTTRVCPPLPDTVEALEPDDPACVAANALYDGGSCATPDAGYDAGDDDDDDDDAGDAAVLDAPAEGG